MVDLLVRNTSEKYSIALDGMKWAKNLIFSFIIVTSM